MSRVVHFEIAADDPERATKFYGNVFGWTFSWWGDQQYWLTMTGDRKEPGIDGAIQARTGITQPVINTIAVKSIDETIARIVENGGKIVVPKMEVAKVGTMVYFSDTEGNIFGAMQFFPDAMM